MAKRKNDEVFGIIGLGLFGMALARALAKMQREILVIDSHEDKIKRALGFADNAYTVSAFTQEALEQAGIGHCDTVIVAIGETIDTSILTTLCVLQMGVKRVVAKAISPEHGAVLEKLGAEVVYPERDMAERVASRLTQPQVLEYIRLSDDVEITEIRLTSQLSNVTVAQSNLRGKFGLNIIAISHAGEIIIDILPDRMLMENDIIAVVGRTENILSFEDFLEE